MDLKQELREQADLLEAGMSFDDGPVVDALRRAADQLEATEARPAPNTNTPEVEEVVGRLERLMANATPLPWMLQDGCSWRRIGTRDGDGVVLCPYNSRSDGHPDLTAGRGHDLYANLELIVSAVNALPGLLALVQRLAGEKAATREVLKAALCVLSGMPSDNLSTAFLKDIDIAAEGCRSILSRMGGGE